MLETHQNRINASDKKAHWGQQYGLYIVSERPIMADR